MKLDIYDTYAQATNGEIIHFDVVVESGTSKEKAFEYAQSFIKHFNSNEITLKQNKCNFCHTENADEESTELIKMQGHYIIPLEGCESVTK